MRITLPCVALLSAVIARPVGADEGQWTPDQIAELDPARLAALGLELDATRLWDPAGDERTGGLMRAAVSFSGCSAAFVSSRGLIGTNHHCAYGALQANSKPERDYIKDGFVARSGADELQAKGKTVRVVRRVTDVTGRVRRPADAAPSDAERARAIERAGKELVQACEAADPDVRCQVAAFYNASQFRLYEFLELRDVRVVWAPPAAIGEFGGEIDNWMWPRHTGDFALVRAYVGPDGRPADFSPENIPYEPGQWLRVSTEGVRPGDFVAVLGYPGRTQRYMSAADVQRSIEQVLPFLVELNGEWLAILARLSAADPAVAIKVAALEKGLANRHKNARGMLDGLGHMQLLERRRAEESKLAEWVQTRPEYAGVLEDLGRITAETRKRHERATLLTSAGNGPNALGIAIDLIRRARAHGVPDLERPAGYMERDEKPLWKRQEGRLRDFDAGVDAALLSSLLAREAALPADQRIAPFAALSRRAGGGKDPTRLLTLASEQVTGTRLGDPAHVERLWNEADAPALARDDDPLLRLANGLVDAIEAHEKEERGLEGALARLRPRYFEMLREVRSGPLYPDANGTLRFSFATVRGYDKWDGSPQTPQTVLAEALAKHTGQEPFDLPAKVRERAADAAATRWADPTLRDLPLCFLSTADTTGGNSGSPVIDGKGRLVGFNFDRVWENIAGDFAYHDGHSRNIVVDVRFLLWMLEEVDGASHLLEELGAATGAGVAAAAPADETPRTAAAATSTAGCGCAAGSVAARNALGLALLLAATRRRDRRRSAPGAR
jgi:MYXO-CTERM domain-containing protein